jgi:hypothetical protein
MGIHLLLEDGSGTLTEKQKDIPQVCRTIPRGSIV